MAATPTGTRSGRKRFGKLDPFCWFALAALALLAILCAVGGFFVGAAIFLALAVILVPADKHWNRP
ncbi:hypothetical protein [Sciscionella marina]|uniref:hypothetical protein n=1 Tax=Sciscionella marina TaxID=508770 RepID=UPI0003703727|nr:hypothetical protein [Sciscionella marina]